jgi:hypothetical protein
MHIHLYDSQSQAKLIHSDRNENTIVGMGKEHKDTFWDDKNVLL